MIKLILLFGLIIVFPSTVAALDNVMHNDLNRFNKTTDGSKDEVRIVVYDKVRGYMNWMQEWFQESARDRCSTKCTISGGYIDRCLYVMLYYALFLMHAPSRYGCLPACMPKIRLPSTIY